MHIKDYVTATYEVLEKNNNHDTVIQGLQTYLKKRGLFSMYPRILRGIRDKAYLHSKSTVPKVVVAREKDINTHTEEISKALEQLDTTSPHETIVDSSIIGGFIIKGRNERIDQSYKGTLLHAYRSLID